MLNLILQCRRLRETMAGSEGRSGTWQIYLPGWDILSSVGCLPQTKFWQRQAFLGSFSR